MVTQDGHDDGSRLLGPPSNDFQCRAQCPDPAAPSDMDRLEFEDRYSANASKRQMCRDEKSAPLRSFFVSWPLFHPNGQKRRLPTGKLVSNDKPVPFHPSRYKCWSGSLLGSNHFLIRIRLPGCFFSTCATRISNLIYFFS